MRVCATVDGELHKFDDRLFLGMQRILNAVEVLYVSALCALSPVHRPICMVSAQADFPVRLAIW